jgi:hypothetical protein
MLLVMRCKISSTCWALWFTSPTNQGQVSPYPITLRFHSGHFSLNFFSSVLVLLENDSVTQQSSQRHWREITHLLSLDCTGPGVGGWMTSLNCCRLCMKTRGWRKGGSAHPTPTLPMLNSTYFFLCLSTLSSKTLFCIFEYFYSALFTCEF